MSQSCYCTQNDDDMRIGADVDDVERTFSLISSQKSNGQEPPCKIPKTDAKKLIHPGEDNTHFLASWQVFINKHQAAFVSVSTNNRNKGLVEVHNQW